MTIRRALGPILALALLLGGCASAPAGIVVSATVDDPLQTVTAPNLALPAISLDAGFTDSTGATNPSTGRTASATSAVAATYGLGTTVRIASVLVTEGQRVRAGQKLATLDATSLNAALASAKADALAARANVGLIGDAIRTTYDKQADLADAKRQVREAISTITRGRSKLLAARRTIGTNLPKARAGLAQIEAAIAAVPAGVPVPPELLDQRAQLKTAIARMSAGLKTIDAALPRLQRGLARATRGLAKLKDATAKVLDARGTLQDQRKLLEILAEAARIPIDIARVQRGFATLTSPVDGVVVQVPGVGAELAPDATLAAIRPAGDSTLTAWLSAAQLDRVCTGDTAEVATDWADSTVAATLTRISPGAEYPPTSLASQEVHLTRAVQVQLTAATQLPAGVPVEVTIHGCHPAAASDDQNG